MMFGNSPVVSFVVVGLTSVYITGVTEFRRFMVHMVCTRPYLSPLLVPECSKLSKPEASNDVSSGGLWPFSANHTTMALSRARVAVQLACMLCSVASCIVQ